MPKFLILLCLTTALLTSTTYATSINYVCDGKKPHSLTSFFTPNTIVETNDEYSETGRTRIVLDRGHIYVINSIFRGTKGEMMIWNRINFAPTEKDKFRAVFLATNLMVKPFSNEVIEMDYASREKLDNCTVFYNPDVKKDSQDEPLPSRP